jgi:hypothetical protein
MTVHECVTLNSPVMIKNHVTAIMLILLSLFSCHKEDLKNKKPTGELKIEIGLYVSVNEEKESLKSTLGAEDFKVIVYNDADEEVLAFEKASEMPDVIQLEAGNYYVTAFSENNLPAAFENPYYFGKSGNFAISPDNQQTVVVNCELGNTIVSVVYSDYVKSNFKDFTTTVSSAEGSLDFVKNETRAGYFKPLPLTIRASLTMQKPDGTFESKILTGTIPDPKPKRKYEIHVNTSAGTGSSVLQINMDESTGPIEIVDITDQVQNTDSVLKGGELLITEIMYDPTALTDAVGEWFEVYNNTNRTLNLQKLVIKKNDTEKHIITESISLLPGSYQVFSRTDNALTGIKYVYGTGISLNNTGAILSVSNYGTDGTDGTIICSVNYGAEGFPSATGASLCLDPGSLNPLDMALGSSWCVSSSVYSTGDKGTPGTANDNCP